MNQQQETQPQEMQLVERFQAIEDRLILACLPLIVLCFLLWAITAAYPGVATLINLIIIILVVFVSCIAIVRLVEVAWQWASDNSDDRPGVPGAALIGFLLLVGVWALIDAIVHAGVATLSRSFVIGGLLLILALQYRAIIQRWMKREQ